MTRFEIKFFYFEQRRIAAILSATNRNLELKRRRKEKLEISTKNLLEELGEDFKKTLGDLSFEKAAKGYKKMRDAEQNRVFMIQIDWRAKINISNLTCHTASTVLLPSIPH